MGREQIELAVLSLRVAHRMFDGGIEGAGQILRARERLQDAVDAARRDEDSAFVVVTSALCEYAENLVAAGNGEGVILCGVQQSSGSAQFLASEAGSEDGWTWPVQVMRSGWAAGSLESSKGV